MPSVTHDARSFMIDGRRIWLVGARVPYARLPRDLWAERIHAAKLAGFNLIESPVFWNRHEPRSGRLDFTGENDLRHFVDLIGKAGLYCSLGVGPYVNAGWDLGGIPAWLVDLASGRLRTTGGPFLEATSRFITALADQIRGWQVTAAGSGGPIVMLQCESEWTCSHEDLANAYLGELNRYLRESGLTVPLINDNQLWASVEGQIDGWSDTENPLEQIRQLAVVRPEQPRIVVDLLSYEPDTWGRPSSPAVTPFAALRRAAEVLAGGGQFIIQSFCAGISFGFTGGRTAQDPHSFVTSVSDVQSLMNEAGAHQNAYTTIRRIATFASRFGRVFANLDPAYRPVSLAPQAASSLELRQEAGEGSAKARKAASSQSTARGGTSIIHGVGSQGSVVFCFGDEPQPTGASAVARPQQVNLILGDGWTLPITLPTEGVAWCLFDVNISGRCRLDYCNVSALGVVGQTMVCFGAPGSRAMISVNGSPVEVDIQPDKPVIIDHEGLTLILVPQDYTDNVFFRDDGVLLGIANLSVDGTVTPLPQSKSYQFVTSGGEQRTVTVEHPRGRHAAEKPPAPALGSWQYASVQDYIDGTSERFATVAGAADMTKLGVPFGYGWYRLTVEAGSSQKIRTLFPFSRDRLHVFNAGKFAAVVGVGPGAVGDASISYKKGPQHLVLLADNLGRFCEGVNLGESKGLYGDVYLVAPIKVAAPKIAPGKTIEVLSFRSPLWEVRSGDTTMPERLGWLIHHKRKSSLVIRFSHPIPSGLVLVNDQPMAYMDSSGPTTYVVEESQFDRGSVHLQIAPVNSADPAADFALLTDNPIEVFEVTHTLSDQADVAFAKWEPPVASAFVPFPKKHEGPSWWRCTFPSDKPVPLYFEAVGMTKGQIYVNGRHLCRYWVATAEGEDVPPQSRYFVPASWLHAPGGTQNELMLFDEHGAAPVKCKFTHAT